MITSTSKPFGRSLSDFGELLSAEKLLCDAVSLGKRAEISEKCPTERTPDNEIRAGFLRFLALGGDEYAPVHEQGVQVFGAWISDVFDVMACDIPGNFAVSSSHFAETPVLLDAHFHGSLVLNGSQLPGLKADRLLVDGNISLTEAFSSNSEIRLLGARIGGDLASRNSRFDNPKGDALSADRAKIEGNVYLDEGFQAQGAVRLPGASIKGDIYCDGGSFSHTEDKNAFVANQMSVTGRFVIHSLRKPVIGIDLTGAEVGALVDKLESWGNKLALDGFVYRHLGDEAPCGATNRIAWLKKQKTEHCNSPNSFKPQPWKQLIRTLRKMGHEEEARQVAIAYETHRRQHKIIRDPVSRFFHFLFGLFIAYGYRPLKLFFIMIGIWFFCAGIYWTAALHDVFTPSNPLVFNHSDYAACRPGYLPGPMQPDVAHPYGNWYLCPQLAGEYTGFSPLTYSLDLILPLVDLQQEHDWAPYIPTPKATWHEELWQFFHPEDWKYHWTRLLVWFEILFGWVASLLLVAVVSGLTNRDKEE